MAYLREMKKINQTPFVLLILLAAGCAGVQEAGTTGIVPSPLVVRGTLSADETWQGAVEVADDLLVPEGITLTIRPGTTVRVVQADTSRTEPEFLDNATEILVRGRLVVKGKEGALVTFEPAAGPATGDDSGWAGIIFDGGGGDLRHSRIAGSEYGLLLLSASPRIDHLQVEGVKHGIMMYGQSRPKISSSGFEAEEGGIYCWRGSAPELQRVRAVAKEREGLLVAPGSSPTVDESLFEGPLAGVLWGRREPPPTDFAAGSSLVVGTVTDDVTVKESSGKAVSHERGNIGPSRPSKTYQGESFIGIDKTWEGEVHIDGTVMVAPGVTLTIRPGTTVSFAWKDTNGDGIGESEIFIQGRLLARGEKERPIVFTAAGRKEPGRWGAVNIMGSDAEENILTHVLVEASYRGLHSHFSRFRVENSFFRKNWRALQFQESTAVILGSVITGNSSGLRFRDSTVVVEGCRVEGNTTGLQTLRSRISLISSSFSDNTLAGIHLRETEGVVAESLIAGNSPGLRASLGRFRLESSVITGNSYGGMQLRGSEAEITGSYFDGNLGNGFFADSSGLVMKNNSLQGNLRFALENNASTPLSAPGNYWGVEREEIPALIFDADDDPSLGAVLFAPPRESPPPPPVTGPR
jgi:plastocyanin